MALHYYGETALMAGLGVLMPPLLGRSGADRRGGLVALVPMTLLGAAAEAVGYLLSRLMLG